MNRLQMLASMVKSDLVVGDVGTDHGYLAYDLLTRGDVPRVIASDLNPAPLASAMKTFECFEKEESIQFRLGSGLSPFALGEVDIYVIAGMGGNLIADILSADIDKAKASTYLLLQPMQQAYQLRKWLCQNSFKIINEQMVREENKFYPILQVAESEVQHEASDLEYHIGINARLDLTYQEYLNHEIRRHQKILQKLDATAHQERYDFVVAYIHSVEEVLDHVHNR